MPKNGKEAEIGAYIKQAKKDKVPKERLYSEFKKKGYPNYVIEYYLSKYKYKGFNALHFIIIGLIAISIISITIYLIRSPPDFQSVIPDSCRTTECFTLKAENCEKAELQRNEDGSIFIYKTNNCQFTKTAAKISGSEDQRIIDLLEGKSLSCSYQENNFNMDWINTLTIGLDQCQGPLKDGIKNILG